MADSLAGRRFTISTKTSTRTDPMRELTRISGLRLPSFGMDAALRAAQAEEVLQKFITLRPPKDEVNEASYRFGQASRFDVLDQPDPEDTGLDVVVRQPDDEPLLITVYNEVSRQVSEVRVENPDDPEQYVMVQRIESIIFSRDDGHLFQFNYTNGSA